MPVPPSVPPLLTVTSAAGGQRSIDQEGAAIDRGRAGVGVDAGEGERTCADLREGTADATIRAAVLEDAGEGGAQIVASHGEIVGTEENISAAFDGAQGEVLGTVRALMSIAPLPKTSTRAVSPVEVPEKKIWPPCPPPEPALAMSIALPAVEEPLNSQWCRHPSC